MPAARHVLRALLPHGAADIKGHMRSYDELLEASGYARRPADFDTLLSILGTELRLITPTDPRGAEAGDGRSEPDHHAGRYYHLTHDYLVPSLREWLTRKERETVARPGGDPSRRTHRGMDRPPFQPLLAHVVGVAGDRAFYPPVAPVACRTAAGGGRDPLSRGPRGPCCGGRGAALPLSPPIGSAPSGQSAAVRELENADAHNVPKVIAEPRIPIGDGPIRCCGRRLTRNREPTRPQRPRAAGALAGRRVASRWRCSVRLIDGDPDLFLVIRQALCDHGDRPALANECRDLLRNEQEASRPPPPRGHGPGRPAGRTAGERGRRSARGRGVPGEPLRERPAGPSRSLQRLAVGHASRPRLPDPPLWNRCFASAGGSESARSSAASVLAKFAADDPDVAHRGSCSTPTNVSLP